MKHGSLKAGRGLLAAMAAAGVGVCALGQERPLTLNGNAFASYSNVRSRMDALGTGTAGMRTTDFPWGFDLNARSYLFDPRFLSFTGEMNLLRGTLTQNGAETKQQNLGWGLGVEFLRQSAYPLRVRYVSYNSDFLQRRLQTTTSFRKSFGVDWSYRKAGKPTVDVGYDNSQYDYGSVVSEPASAVLRRPNRSRLLTSGVGYAWRGWQNSVRYSRGRMDDWGTQAVVDQEFAQATTQRNFSGMRMLTLLGTYQAQEYANQGLGLKQSFPLANLRAEFTGRPSEKHNYQLFHEYFRSDFRTARLGLTAAEAPAETAAAGGGNSFQRTGGAETYRPVPSLEVGVMADVARLSPWAIATGATSKMANVSGRAAWHKRFWIVEPRASVTRGIGFAAMQSGESRQVPITGYSAGLQVGSLSKLALSGDYSVYRRPEIYQIGGETTTRLTNLRLDSRAMRGLSVSAEANRNEMDILAARGRERMKVDTMSASVIQRWVSLQGIRTVTKGERSYLYGAVGGLGSGIVTVPVEEILRSPLIPNRGAQNSAAMTLRPWRSLELQGRYTQQRYVFRLGSQDSRLEQYEAFLTYRLGKFQVTAGVLHAEGVANFTIQNNWNSYFIRVSRAFHIL